MSRRKKLTAELLVSLVGYEMARHIIVEFEQQWIPSICKLAEYERKMKAVEAFLNYEPPAVICMRYQISRSALNSWVKQYKQKKATALDAAQKIVEPTIDKVE